MHIRAQAQYRVSFGEGHAHTAAASIVKQIITIGSQNMMKPSTVFRPLFKIYTDNLIGIMIDQALKVYSARKYHLNEFARALYKRTQLLSKETTNKRPIRHGQTRTSCGDRL